MFKLCKVVDCLFTVENPLQYHQGHLNKKSAQDDRVLNVERQGRRPWRSSEGEEKCLS
jgi:hypothetical protein